MVLVIQTFVYPQAWIEHLLWASVLIFLLTRGPGTLSIDHLLAKHLRGPG
jgi:putative oxidoreductase